VPLSEPAGRNTPIVRLTDKQCRVKRPLSAYVRAMFADDTLAIVRDEHGVPHVTAKDDAAMYRGMGYCHARDRGLQMLMMRILGRGELCKQLDASDASLQVDLFFRRTGWARGLDEEIDPATRALLDAYCDGVNARFARKVPWELRVAGYKHAPWRVEDCIVVARVISFLTLAQSQGDLERFLVELIQAGVGVELLEELYPGRLAGLDVELVKRVVLGERHVPADLKWASAGRMTASNNWVVAGSQRLGRAAARERSAPRDQPAAERLVRGRGAHQLGAGALRADGDHARTAGAAARQDPRPGLGRHLHLHGCHRQLDRGGARGPLSPRR
jgi:acyl-homoserine lactone acylase PvdQ